MRFASAHNPNRTNQGWLHAFVSAIEEFDLPIVQWSLYQEEWGSNTYHPSPFYYMLLAWFWNIVLMGDMWITRPWCCHIVSVRINHTNDANTGIKKTYKNLVFCASVSHTQVHFAAHSREKIQRMPRSQAAIELSRPMALKVRIVFFPMISHSSYLSPPLFHCLQARLSLLSSSNSIQKRLKHSIHRSFICIRAHAFALWRMMQRLSCIISWIIFAK